QSMTKEEAAGARIRRAAPDDAAPIAATLYGSFLAYEASYTPEAFAATVSTPGQILERMREGPIWVALENGALVGTVSVVLKGEALYIRGMAVSPAARGKRLGRRLLECAEEFARQNGCKRLFLSTTPFLTRAIRLYEHYGFHRTNDEPHDLCGTPLFTMVKPLV
ncbi:MAG TPA: GNAT family N-acetyltransferase, partial [Pyrinomonadaceae bacterium]|nr:GNAT family N-acetyltransferase [Pyrinomonadaceae bacterium]